MIKSSQKKYSIQKIFEQKNNVTNVHGTKVLNNEKIYKNYLKCSIIFFLLSDYEKWCHNVNGVFKAFLIRVRRPKFDTSTHHFFHVWLTCRKMSGF